MAGSGVCMTASEREAIRALVAELGERGAAIVLCVDVRTLARALAGLGILRVTAAAIRGALDQRARLKAAAAADSMDASIPSRTADGPQSIAKPVAPAQRGGKRCSG